MYISPVLIEGIVTRICRVEMGLLHESMMNRVWEIFAMQACEFFIQAGSSTKSTCTLRAKAW
jgi:hypothetical protein